MGEPQDKFDDMAKLELENFEEFRTLEGKQLPAGDWLTVTQEMINDFAKATMDFQWIHVDVEKAEKHSPFKNRWPMVLCPFLSYQSCWLIQYM